MEPLKTEFKRFVTYYYKHKDFEKADKVFDDVLVHKFSTKEYITFSNLSLCLTIKELADHLSNFEKKKVTEIAVKKRLERAHKKLKDHFKAVFNED